MSTILVDGLKYGERGISVILMHGWGQNTAMMEHIALFLKDHFVVYNFDFPGFGKSDEPNRAFSVDDYTEWFAHFLKELGVENPILIGHSFGCRVAVRYAYKYPVRRMVQLVSKINTELITMPRFIHIRQPRSSYHLLRVSFLNCSQR